MPKLRALPLAMFAVMAVPVRAQTPQIAAVLDAVSRAGWAPAQYPLPAEAPPPASRELPAAAQTAPLTPREEMIKLANTFDKYGKDRPVSPRLSEELGLAGPDQPELPARWGIHKDHLHEGGVIKGTLPPGRTLAIVFQIVFDGTPQRSCYLLTSESAKLEQAACGTHGTNDGRRVPDLKPYQELFETQKVFWLEATKIRKPAGA